MKKIALIENTGMIRIKFANVLRSYGFDDLVSCSFEEIERRGLLAQIKKTSLVFIDCDSSDVNYKELISRLRSGDSEEKLIVTMSSFTDQKRIIELLAIGANDILAKPYSDIKLMEKVFKHMEKPVMTQVEKSQVIAEEVPLGRYMPEWHKDFEIGIESVDTEHKDLLEQYERLYQVMRDGKGHEYSEKLLNYLEDYVVTHFDNEEKLQKDIKYSAFEEHKRIHEEFKDELKSIAQQFSEGGFDNYQLIKFSLFLKNWCMHHILVEDKKYMEFIDDGNIEVS